MLIVNWQNNYSTRTIVHIEVFQNFINNCFEFD